jgi:P4 family phage/plasmid primase-like protien
VSLIDNGPSIDTAERFFRAMFSDDLSGHVVIWNKGGNSKFPLASDPHGCAVAAQGVDQYFGLGLQPEIPASGRGFAKDVSCIVCMWADIDVYHSTAHASANLAPTIDDAVAVAYGLLPPSIIVHSGHGVQAYWLLDEPWLLDSSNFAEAEALPVAFQTALQGSTQWKIDTVADLARVFRVPGTINNKDSSCPVEVKILELHPDRRYSRQQIRESLPATVASVAQTSAVGDGFVSGNRNNHLTKLAGSMRKWDASEDEIMAAFTAINDGSEHPLSEKELRQTLRSAMRWKPEAEIASGGTFLSFPDDYPPSDLGNARRFVDNHARDMFRYATENKEWLVWDGKRWSKDTLDLVHRQAAISAVEIFDASEAEPDDGKRKKLQSWALRSQSATSIQAAVTIARSQPEIAMNVSAFDNDPWLLNVANGTLDLRAGVLLPHNPTDLITKLTDVEYDPAATCPRFERFLSEVFPNDGDSIGLCQRYAGYNLTGSVREHIILFAYGDGRNGKSVLLNTLTRVMGSYAQTVAASELAHHDQEHHTTGLTDLAGKRMATSIETGQGKQFNEQLIKELSSADPITARRMHANFFTFQPTHKLWIASNHLPLITSTDDGIWKRFAILPFTQSFVGREDRTLEDDLARELPGVLAWMMRGCVEWQQGGLQIPQSVLEATDEHRHVQDHVGAFLEDMFIMDGESSVASNDIYAAYEYWCKTSGERHPWSMKRMAPELKKRGCAAVRVGSPQVRMWKGLRLISLQWWL